MVKCACVWAGVAADNLWSSNEGKKDTGILDTVSVGAQ